MQLGRLGPDARSQNVISCRICTCRAERTGSPATKAAHRARESWRTEAWLPPIAVSPGLFCDRGAVSPVQICVGFDIVATRPDAFQFSTSWRPYFATSPARIRESVDHNRRV